MIPEDRRRHRVCVVIPAYREQQRIGAVVAAVRAQGLDAVVVDDGSDDGTARAAESAGAIVIRHEKNAGKGVALNTGFAHAREKGYHVVITMDADGQHDPADLPKFVEAYVRTGIPVLVGNRMANPVGMPLIRRWTNQFMSYLLSRVMGQYVPDTQCGYRLYRCDLLPLASARSERFAAESEVLLHAAHRGIRMASVHIASVYAGGKSEIRPFADTVRFVSMLLEYKRSLRR